MLGLLPEPKVALIGLLLKLLFHAHCEPKTRDSPARAAETSPAARTVAAINLSGRIVAIFFDSDGFCIGCCVGLWLTGLSIAKENARAPGRGPRSFRAVGSP